MTTYQNKLIHQYTNGISTPMASVQQWHQYTNGISTPMASVHQWQCTSVHQWHQYTNGRVHQYINGISTPMTAYISTSMLYFGDPLYRSYHSLVSNMQMKCIQREINLTTGIEYNDMWFIEHVKVITQ